MKIYMLINYTSKVNLQIDAGALLHLIVHKSINLHGAHSKKGEATPSHFSSRIQSMVQAFNDDKLEEPNCASAQAGDKVSIKWLTAGRIYI
jgi:hypothetical protein